jgi:hypothetical protein
MRYPVIGSIALLSLFLAVKFLPKYLISYIITFYFCSVGVLAIGGACSLLLRNCLTTCPWWAHGAAAHLVSL